MLYMYVRVEEVGWLLQVELFSGSIKKLNSYGES